MPSSSEQNHPTRRDNLHSEVLEAIRRHRELKAAGEAEAAAEALRVAQRALDAIVARRRLP